MNDKPFTVGTFVNGRHISCYTTWYNKSWSGCIEYTVQAVNGAHAKRQAKKLRKDHEAATR